MTYVRLAFRPKRIAVLLPVIILAVGCAAPGPRLLRSGIADGQGPLIAGCQNVSAAYQVSSFNTTSYLSTYGSAFSEGAMEGVRKGTEKNKNTAGSGAVLGGASALGVNIGAEGEKKGERSNDLSGNPQAFCMSYSASFSDVSKTIEEVLKTLDYSLEVSDPEQGTFITGYTNRQHPMAAWRDRYELTVSDEEAGSTVVRVYRWLYISRKKGVYGRATSAGQNEAWILKQIAEKLAAKG